MTLQEKQQELTNKYMPDLIAAGFVNPTLRFDINLVEGLTEDSIIIGYDSTIKTATNYNKTYVGQSILLQVQGDIINKIFNELHNFVYNRNLSSL